MSNQQRNSLPNAVDLSHHLSRLARARTLSPLKRLHKYWGQEGIISLAGGLPHPDLFPFDDISANRYSEDTFPAGPPPSKSAFISWVAGLFSLQRKSKTDRIRVPKYAAHPGDIDLATVLQYGLSSGLPQLQNFIKEFVGRVYRPAYSDWAVLIDIGNTDGWAKAFMTLCNPGDAILTEEWTYPSAIAATHPFSIKAVGIPIDEEGMRSDALFHVLSTWDETERGTARPHLMYTVPVGQNPTGTTMHAQRKREIYELCVKFDVIIVEDDPYYFLQEGSYTPKRQRPAPQHQTNEDFLASLVPSYLRLDYQGRVIRLDSFSKTIAPGCRLGWFTCNSLFAERLERQSETSTQMPCGFGQALVTSLLLDWKFDGYVTWLKGLRGQYRDRRDLCLDTFADVFHLEARTESTGTVVYDGYIKSKSRTGQDHNWAEKFVDADNRFPVFTFVPPTSGMFLWLRIHFKNHPRLREVGYGELETRLWTMTAEAGVLVGPGSVFSSGVADGDDREGPGHFRLSFSNVTVLQPQVLRRATEIMEAVLDEFFFGGDNLL